MRDSKHVVSTQSKTPAARDQPLCRSALQKKRSFNAAIVGRDKEPVGYEVPPTPPKTRATVTNRRTHNLNWGHLAMTVSDANQLCTIRATVLTAFVQKHLAKPPSQPLNVQTQALEQAFLKSRHVFLPRSDPQSLPPIASDGTGCKVGTSQIRSRSSGKVSVA